MSVTLINKSTMESLLPVGLSIFVDTDCPGKAEIREFKLALLGDQDIGSFHVTVNYFVAVNVVQPIQQLLHHLLYFTWNKR